MNCAVMSSEKIKLLLIDDDADDRFILRRKLGAQFEIDESATLAAGLARIDFGLYYCTLLDLNLPDSEPLRTARRFRLAAPGAPMVVLSGFSHPEIVKQTIAAGADAFLVKDQVFNDAEPIIKAMRCAVSQRVILNRLDRVNETVCLCRAELQHA